MISGNTMDLHPGFYEFTFLAAHIFWHVVVIQTCPLWAA